MLKKRGATQLKSCPAVRIIVITFCYVPDLQVLHVYRSPFNSGYLVACVKNLSCKLWWAQNWCSGLQMGACQDLNTCTVLFIKIVQVVSAFIRHSLAKRIWRLFHCPVHVLYGPAIKISLPRGCLYFSSVSPWLLLGKATQPWKISGAVHKETVAS